MQVTLPPAGRRKMNYPQTVAGKIEEGQRKVQRMEIRRAKMDREIEMLKKVQEALEAELDFELSLVANCGDLEITRRARQRCRPRPPLSDVETQALRDIRDLAVSVIVEYTDNVAPLPVYDHPINPLSDSICHPLPVSMTEVSASHHR